ncbi:hypothetical protein COO60DRAFT_1627044 [Scenedesmus sp. NREL 46B-D3]|nr:hypothetical protein COO60DRAFT_1627044 [Scenedesmus sp. NREL 46B-D3]
MQLKLQACRRASKFSSCQACRQVDAWHCALGQVNHPLNTPCQSHKGHVARKQVAPACNAIHVACVEHRAAASQQLRAKFEVPYGIDACRPATMHGSGHGRVHCAMQHRHCWRALPHHFCRNTQKLPRTRAADVAQLQSSVSTQLSRNVSAVAQPRQPARSSGPTAAAPYSCTPASLNSALSPLCCQLSPGHVTASMHGLASAAASSALSCDEKAQPCAGACAAASAAGVGTDTCGVSGSAAELGAAAAAAPAAAASVLPEQIMQLLLQTDDLLQFSDGSGQALEGWYASLCAKQLVCCSTAAVKMSRLNHRYSNLS